jgi:hypothetical protein
VLATLDSKQSSSMPIILLYVTIEVWARKIRAREALAA